MTEELLSQTWSWGTTSSSQSLSTYLLGLSACSKTHTFAASPFRRCTNLPCAPGQFSSHLPLTVPTSSLFALISTSSTKLHSLVVPSAATLSSSASVSVLKHLHVVRCTSPSGALMIHSMPSSVSVMFDSNETVESHSPLGSACMWSVIL